MPEGEVIDLTDLPDDPPAPPAPAGLDPNQRAMAQQLLNVYPREFLRDALASLLERQGTAIELAVYQALLASGAPAAVQGPPPAAYIPPPGIMLPPYAAYGMNHPAPAPAYYQPVALPPVYPAQPGPYPDDHYSEEDEDEDGRQHEICARCNEEFDPDDDDDESCLYHRGKLTCTETAACVSNSDAHIGYLRINYHAEGWADWDEDVHGPMDTDEHREEWPENFTWTCCEKAGDDYGCEVGPHSVH